MLFTGVKRLLTREHESWDTSHGLSFQAELGHYNNSTSATNRETVIEKYLVKIDRT